MDIDMSIKEFMNLSDSEIKDRYLDNGSFNITNFYYMGKIYTPGKFRRIKLKKPYPTIKVEEEGGGKLSRKTITITYRTKKMRIMVEMLADKLSYIRIDREGYDSRYTTNRDS